MRYDVEAAKLAYGLGNARLRRRLIEVCREEGTLSVLETADCLREAANIIERPTLVSQFELVKRMSAKHASNPSHFIHRRLAELEARLMS